MFSLQKKIRKRNYCIIKLVIDYCLKSNMHTRRGLTIRLKKLKPRAPDFWVPKILGARAISTISVSNYFCFGSAHILYYAGNKRSLYKNDREKLRNDDVDSLYGVEDLLMARIMCGTKRLNPFVRLHEASEVLNKYVM